MGQVMFVELLDKDNKKKHKSRLKGIFHLKFKYKVFRDLIYQSIFCVNTNLTLLFIINPLFIKPYTKSIKSFHF